MLPATFDQIKTLCIVFPGAAGGHHLANLISCCNEFIQYHTPAELLDLYAKHDQYLEMYIPYPNKVSVQDYKAHFFDLNHYFVDKIDSPEYPIDSDKVDIIAGHTHMFHAKQSILNKIPNPAWIMMSWPNDNTLPGIRRIKMNSQNQVQRTYHWPNTYIQHTNSPCDDYGFNLNTEQFWTKEGSNYLRELLLTNFGIHLPAVADNIHAIWWSWMTKVLDTEMP